VEPNPTFVAKGDMLIAKGDMGPNVPPIVGVAGIVGLEAMPDMGPVLPDGRIEGIDGIGEFGAPRPGIGAAAPIGVCRTATASSMPATARAVRWMRFCMRVASSCVTDPVTLRSLVSYKR
jgi:hypothetical protein